MASEEKTENDDPHLPASQKMRVQIIRKLRWLIRVIVGQVVKWVLVHLINEYADSPVLAWLSPALDLIANVLSKVPWW